MSGEKSGKKMWLSRLFERRIIPSLRLRKIPQCGWSSRVDTATSLPQWAGGLSPIRVAEDPRQSVPVVVAFSTLIGRPFFSGFGSLLIPGSPWIAERVGLVGSLG